MHTVVASRHLPHGALSTTGKGGGAKCNQRRYQRRPVGDQGVSFKEDGRVGTHIWHVRGLGWARNRRG